MAGLNISPLRGLLNFLFTPGDNLIIPSGFKMMTQRINHVNKEAFYPFGRKILCDGYVMKLGARIFQ